MFGDRKIEADKSNLISQQAPDAKLLIDSSQVSYNFYKKKNERPNPLPGNLEVSVSQQILADSKQLPNSSQLKISQIV